MDAAEFLDNLDDGGYPFAPDDDTYTITVRAPKGVTFDHEDLADIQRAAQDYVDEQYEGETDV